MPVAMTKTRKAINPTLTGMTLPSSRSNGKAKPRVLPNVTVPCPKKRSAKEIVLPTFQAPTAQHNGNGKAGDAVSPKDHAPSPSLEPEHARACNPLSAVSAMSSRAPQITMLRELQAQRVAAIRFQIRCINAARALARRRLGFRIDLPEKERNAISKAAGELVKKIESGADVSDAIAATVLAMAAGRAPMDARRAAIERNQRELVRGLPGYARGMAIKGFGELGMAIIVGEAGDLASYSNPAKLWKRMGVATPQSYDSVTLAGEPCNKKPKRRRSALYTIGDALVKTNGDDGEYRGLYLARKAMELARTDDNKPKSQGHADYRARRYMEKRLLRNLWRAWRADCGLGGNDAHETFAASARDTCSGGRRPAVAQMVFATGAD